MTAVKKKTESREFAQFSRFYASCPVCGKENEAQYLERFFFSTAAEDERLKKALSSVAAASTLAPQHPSHDRVKIGIPCCDCYRKYSGAPTAALPEFPVFPWYSTPWDGRGAYDGIYKVVVGSAPDVDKEAIINRLSLLDQPNPMRTTIGVRYRTQLVSSRDERIVLVFWEVSGQARFRFLWDSCIRGAKCGLVVFDVHRRETLDAAREWIGLIHRYAPCAPIILLGTDIALGEFSEFERINDVASTFAADNQCVYIPVSPSENMFIHETMSYVASMISYNARQSRYNT